MPLEDILSSQNKAILQEMWQAGAHAKWIGCSSASVNQGLKIRQIILLYEGMMIWALEILIRCSENELWMIKK
jgi:hypothetical protein